MTRFTDFMDEMADETEQDDEPLPAPPWRAQLPGNVFFLIVGALVVTCWAIWWR